MMPLKKSIRAKLSQIPGLYNPRAGMDHETFTPPNNPIGTSIQEWASGVKQRTLHPLETLAKAATDVRNMSAQDMAMQFGGPSGGALAGIIRGTKAAPKVSMTELLYGKDNINQPRSGHALPTRQQYEDILWKQKIEAQQAQADFQRRMQEAIDADARHAAERGNVQSASGIQNKLTDEEWLRQFQEAGGAANRSATNRSARGWDRE